MNFIELLLIIVPSWFLGVCVGLFAERFRWTSNTIEPTRLLIGKTFYKVVNLSSMKSWKYLDIHDYRKE